MSKNKIFSDTAASRYSLALYELAEETKLVQEIENQSLGLIKLIDKSKDFTSIIKNPTNKKEDQINVINKISEQYIYNFIIDNPGIYRMQILAKDDYSNYKSNQEYVVVSDFDIESQFLYQNQNSIYKFKAKNNSNYFDFENLSSNLDKIKINTMITRQDKNLNSLSTQYYWIIFILLLAIEWYLRKRSKLL